MQSGSLDGQTIRSPVEESARNASEDVLRMIGEFGVTEYVARDFLAQYGENLQYWISVSGCAALSPRER